MKNNEMTQQHVKTSQKSLRVQSVAKISYYQSKFIVSINAISTQIAMVFFTQYKKEGGNGITYLLSQRLGTGGRRIRSSNITLATQ